MQLLQSDWSSCLSIRSSAAWTNLMNTRTTAKPNTTTQLCHIWPETHERGGNLTTCCYSHAARFPLIGRVAQLQMCLRCENVTIWDYPAGSRHFPSTSGAVISWSRNSNQRNNGGKASLLSANGISPLALGALWSPRQHRTLADGGLKIQTVWYYRRGGGCVCAGGSLSLIKLQHHASTPPHPLPRRPLAHPQDCCSKLRM